MDVLDEAKLEAAADRVVALALAKLQTLTTSILEALDGWTVTITLNKPK